MALYDWTCPSCKGRVTIARPMAESDTPPEVCDKCGANTREGWERDWSTCNVAMSPGGLD